LARPQKEGKGMEDMLIITLKMIEEMKPQDIINKLSDKEAELINVELSDYEYGIMSAIMNCESPIERLLAVGMYSVGLGCLDNFYPDIVIGGIDAQVPIEANDIMYRVDFHISTLFKYEIIHSFIVECDGHDFHEKTKQQAQRDKQRERNLIAAGYTVIRFTGSEIYNNPYKCAKEIIKIIVGHYTGR
jgi:very-short-patch-repair endonuclease